MDKSYWCAFYLRELARAGIHSVDEVPILLRQFQIWPVHYKSTQFSAETLQIITGLDVGYNEEFVDNYTEADESERLQMLATWRGWYDKEVSTTK